MNHLLESLINKAKKDPNPRVFFRICEEYRKSENFLQVIEYGTKGLEIDKHHLPTLLVVGKSCLELNKLEEASSYFQRILEMDTLNIRANFGLASCLIKLGFLGEAEPYIENLRILQPSLIEELQLTDMVKESMNEVEKVDVEESQSDDTVNDLDDAEDPTVSNESIHSEASGQTVEQLVSPSERKLIRLKMYLSKIRSHSSV